MDKEILLQLKNVAVHYGGIKALDGVDICIDEGESVALMGPNGAGKSTILKTIFGLAPIQSGRILWHEKNFCPVSYKVAHRGIAYVPQGRRVFTHLTVEENLEIGGIIINDKQELRRRIEELMGTFPMLRVKKKMKSGALSGGQQQILAIARGLMSDPKILLLDEPSLGLSPKHAKEIFTKIREINERQKIAIMIVEHNIKHLLDIAHRVYVLDKGKVAAEGTPKELLTGDTLEKIFMGKAG